MSPTTALAIAALTLACETGARLIYVREDDTTVEGEIRRISWEDGVVHLSAGVEVFLPLDDVLPGFSESRVFIESSEGRALSLVLA